jgi:hypothetical protein
VLGDQPQDLERLEAVHQHARATSARSTID